jgi:hypothetical protein
MGGRGGHWSAYVGAVYFASISNMNHISVCLQAVVSRPSNGSHTHTHNQQPLNPLCRTDTASERHHFTPHSSNMCESRINLTEFSSTFNFLRKRPSSSCRVVMTTVPTGPTPKTYISLFVFYLAGNCAGVDRVLRVIFQFPRLLQRCLLCCLLPLLLRAPATIGPAYAWLRERHRG